MNDFGTPVDKPYAQQPETRDAALRYLKRSGNGDVAQILGLVDPTCPLCNDPMPARGGCRPCRAASTSRFRSSQEES